MLGRMFRVDRLPTHPLSEGRLPLAAESKTIFLRLELLYGYPCMEYGDYGRLRVEKYWCWFSINPTAHNHHQNETAAKPPREQISALEMIIRLMTMTMIIIITVQYSETHLRVQYPPARASRPGWQLLDLRLSWTHMSHSLTGKTNERSSL
jgi:hypothetical protein